MWRGRAIDQVFSGFAMLGASIPSFWFGLILMQIFAVALGWFPVAGYGDPGVPLADRLHHLVLPAIVLGVVNSALILRFTRASMLDVLGEDHIRTARAKGALGGAGDPAPRLAQRPDSGAHRARPDLRAARRRRDRHRDRVRPARRSATWSCRRCCAATIPVIQGALLVIAGLYVLINLAIDLLYLVVDPRVTY